MTFILGMLVGAVIVLIIFIVLIKNPPNFFAVVN